MATEHQFELSYSAPQNHHTYSLLELSPALLEQIEKGETRLDIVGLPSDESVMTTEADTLALRSVRSSNTMLLCQPSTSKQATNQEPSRLHSLASLNQTLDLVPVRPRVERIEELLRGQEWSNSDPTDYRPSKKHKAYSEENLLDVVQASPKQLSDYLQKAHILQIGTRLRPVSPSYIPTLLSSLILSIDDSKGATDEDVFAKEAEITPTVARQVLSWYNQEGTINKAHVVKDIGLAILQSWPANELRSALALPGVTAAAPTRKLVVPLSKLLERWKKWAGPEQDLCTLDLLRGNFLQEDADGITSVPASELSILEPQERFAFLFKLRPKWSPSDMEPFLDGITVNPKDREKWVLKCVRKVKQGSETVWLPR